MTAARPRNGAVKAAHQSRTTARTAATVPAATSRTHGQQLHDFALPVSGGGSWRLRDSQGAVRVLYFYPRDLTPGCTLEAQEFNALVSRFRRGGIVLAGVSRDTLASHERFCHRHALAVPLLSDSDGTVCRQFDVIREKTLYGRKVMGIERSTFLIDREGTVAREWRRVRVPGHALEVLTAAQAL